MMGIAGLQYTQLVQVIEAGLRHKTASWDLVTFAQRRHGFGDDDGGFGLTYAAELDAFDQAQGRTIPPGHVEVYGHWAKVEWGGFEFVVEEQEYLSVLENVLRGQSRLKDADDVRALIDQPFGPRE